MANRLINDLYPTMPWDKIDAVVFDIGNVLVSMNEAAVLETLFPGNKALQRRVQLHTTMTPYWSMLDCGTLDLEEAINVMACSDASLAEPIRRFLTEWPNYRYVVEEGKQAALSCKAHGKKLFILSNYTSENYQRNIDEYDFFSLFDGAVISAREHMLKPRLDIYNLLVSRYHLTPERTLFIDDMPANIEGAFSAGWHGFCMNESGKLAAFLNGDNQ